MSLSGSDPGDEPQSYKPGERYTPSLASVLPPPTIAPADPPPVPADLDSTPNQPGPAEFSLLPSAVAKLIAPNDKPPSMAGGTQAVSAEGSRCTIQTLYEGPPKCQCCKNWVEEYPDDLRDAVEEQPDVKQKALVVRMRKSHKPGKPLELDSIVIQSQSLKKTLGEVFEGYQGITTDLKKLVFHAPFRPFYYRWGVLKATLERQGRENPDAASFTRLLYDVLNAELRDTITEVDDLAQHGVITYPLLWSLFEPGEVVVEDSGADQQFHVVEKCAYDHEKGYLAVSTRFVDWNGERFGYSTVTLGICGFGGTKRIKELGVFPMRYHEAREDAKTKAIKRGTKFFNLRGMHYLAHSGVARQASGEKLINGRIVVDATAFFHANQQKKRPLKPLTSGALVPTIDVKDKEHDSPQLIMSACGNSYRWRDDHQVKEPPLFRQKGQALEPSHNLTNEHLLLCATHVRGYSLKLNDWAEFRVEDVTDIAWNDDGFPNLILPGGMKKLVLSFVEGHSNKKPALNDIIEGKGLGMIMMLAGSPGTGKTLTAEAVADKVRRPLYVLSAGELGDSAKRVETRLKEVLELTEGWDAVLLFDECDVFIQERSTNNIQHNEIVAVFLRLLEYYRGILIMTTNRVGAIDRAMHSRIHLTLHYPDLEPAAKERIWRQFTARSGLELSLTEGDFARFSHFPMNGRQIKNVVKVAVLLATEEKEALGAEHVRTVLQATREAGVDCDF